MSDIESPGERNFLGLSEPYSSCESSFFQIIQVPYDGTSTYIRGARMGPRAIVDASANLEIYDHELDLEAARCGIATHKELKVIVGDPERMLAQIETEVRGIFSQGCFPVVIGGEHTVGLGAVKALASESSFTLVCLDAHADLRDSYQGSAYSHACYLKRASELVDCCVFGVRSISRDEVLYVKEAGVRVFWADRLLSVGVDQVNLGWLPETVYLSVDLDILDPSIMPATGTPEPGGLGWYETIRLLERIVTGRKVVGFDVVELCPLPGNPAPDFTAAKLIYKLMGLILKVSQTKGKEWIGHGKEKIQKEATR